MPPPETSASPSTGHRVAHLVRRFNLEARNHVKRGSYWYWGYHGVRWMFQRPAGA